jgi:hypothetical protein
VSGGQVVLVHGDYLGRGDQRLGSTLIAQFFRALARREEDLPTAILFLNTGVRLLIDGSPVLVPLQELESRSVTILADRASAQHFDLEDKIEVGDTAPMTELVERLIGANVVAL